jgi:ribosomal protein S18 acetylase RimI-like enzyme
VSAWILRQATEQDAEAVAAIWYGGWADGHLGNVPEVLLAHRDLDSFRRRTPERIAGTTVAVIDGDVVAFVTVIDDEIEQVYVASAARGTGVAAALMVRGEEVIAGRFDEAWLAVVEGNGRARRFYEKQGWRDGGSRAYEAQIDGGTVTIPVRRYTKRVRP